MKHTLILLFAFAGSAHAGGWTADLAASKLEFSGVAQEEAFSGEFKRFRPDIQFDPAHLSAACFDVRIDLASVDTQNAERDSALAEADFFDIANHPEARFQATAFSATAEGYLAAGELTLRGTTAPVLFDFKWTIDGKSRLLEGHAVLDRSVFGVGSGDWLGEDAIAHRVEVRTRVLLHPTP